jgi:hypothetical protein
MEKRNGDGSSKRPKGRSEPTLENAATGNGGRRRRQVQCGGMFMFGGTFEELLFSETGTIQSSPQTRIATAAVS